MEEDNMVVAGGACDLLVMQITSHTTDIKKKKKR